MYTDLPVAELQSYRGSVVEPPDFDDFWAASLREARGYPLQLSVVEHPTALATVDVFDVRFTGSGGLAIAAWLLAPKVRLKKLPVVVEYLGYGGGRGRPVEHLLWASAGYAHLVMDTRGQGSGWSAGDTPDPVGSGPASPGFLTRGIEHRDDYYYRRVTVDAVRAVEAARSLPLVDPDRVAVLGTSQGGGLALAVGGLVRDLAAVVARVPFLCDFPRAIGITDSDPYQEIVRYLAVHRTRETQVLATLAYFDSVLHAQRGTSAAYISVALMDGTCPPSTVYAAFNAWPTTKHLRTWRFNRHEGGGADEDEATLVDLQRALG